MKKAEIDGQIFQVTSTVDAVGLFCPLPVVKLKLEMENIKPNEIVELLADDPGVNEDLAVWCRETGQKLIAIGRNDEGIISAYVEKQTG